MEDHNQATKLKLRSIAKWLGLWVVTLLHFSYFQTGNVPQGRSSDIGTIVVYLHCPYLPAISYTSGVV
jgi:hypothetical protein